MATYQCGVCGYTYNEETQGIPWSQLPDGWTCPVCGADKSKFTAVMEAPTAAEQSPAASTRAGEYLLEWRRTEDAVETYMADIHRMAETGETVIDSMRTPLPVIGWDDVFIKGAQLAKFPLNEDVPVNTTTVIGPKAGVPLAIDIPLYVSHMSFGALSREAKVALAKGSAMVKTMMCSGEGGILEESLRSAYKYVFEYVPNRYGVTDENLREVDAIEIKVGQSAKPGLGGHLPGNKVTAEIAAARGRPQGQSITSPARFDDIHSPDDLRSKVEWLREKSGGKPIGIKLAAGDVEADLGIALYGRPDFVTIDGRPGGTGSAPKFIKNAASVPTLFALHRARKFLDKRGARHVTLLITGGFRVPSDMAKALAMGADAVALGTAALIAVGCQQYRLCATGRCPVGVTTHDPVLRSRLDVETSARRVANFFKACAEELKEFARMTGNNDVHGLSVKDLCTANSEISDFTDIEHV